MGFAPRQLALPKSMWSKYEGRFSELFPEKLEEEPAGVADN